MKKIFSIFAAILITVNMFLPQQASAQSPEKMSYQAVVRDGSNNLVSSTTVGMQISILLGSTSGTAVYVETQTPTSNVNGLVSIEIGAGTVVSGDFATIDWANGPYFIKTETDLTGGTNYTITGTSQLLSVPYALHAKTAESISGGITETDPVFGASLANDITAADTTYWNDKLDSYTETDPVFGASLANDITAADTTYWNNKLDSYTETDPTFTAYFNLAGATEGDLLRFDGSKWVAQKAGVGSIISTLANAPTTILTVGNFQFRYNSTTTGGYIEVKTVTGGDYLMVFATKSTGSWYLSSTTSTTNYRNATSAISSGWNPVMSLWNGSAWDDRVTLSTYETFEATLFSMGSGSSSVPSTLNVYKLFAAIDGYNHIFISVEYSID